MKYIVLGIAVIVVFASCQSESKRKSDANKENTETPQVKQADTTGEAIKETSADKGKLGQIERGMTSEEVKALAGEPDRIDQLNANPGSKVEDWFYGKNQKVRFVRDVVNRVVFDLEKEAKLLKEIIKAKQAGNTEKAKSLMEELESLDSK